MLLALTIINSNPFFQNMKKQMSGPNKDYLRYFLLLMILSPIFNQLVNYSRYPMPKFLNYDNIALLNNSRNKLAIDKISELLCEMIKLVPLVWNKIDYFKNKIK
jgi:hypothetical protein